MHYTALTLVPTNPVNDGAYTGDCIDWYPEDQANFPIIIDTQNTNFDPYGNEAGGWIRIWVKKGTTLANGLMSIYNEYGTNKIGTYPAYGTTLFANYGLKSEVGPSYDCQFYKFTDVQVRQNDICFEIELTAQESDMEGKIYYEDQSGNKWYLFEWYRE